MSIIAKYNKLSAKMDSTLTFYTFANALGLVIVGILLYFNVSRCDFQVKRQALTELFLSTMIYIAIDIPWTYINHGLLLKTTLTQVASSYVLAIAAIYLISSWLAYSFTISGKTKFDFKRFLKVIRIIDISTSVILALLMFINPDIWVEEGSITLLFYIIVFGPMLLTLGFIGTYSFIRSGQKIHYARKREYRLNGIGPFVLIVFTIFQMMNNDSPILVYGMIVSMLLIFLSVILFQTARDPLTGLNNRNQLERIITNIGKEKQTDKNYILVMVDANDFKHVNDKLGHVKGDEVLQCIAETLISVCQKYKERPLVCRYGGDEFVLFFKDTKEEEIQDLQELVNAELARRLQGFNVSVSIGYAFWNGDMEQYEACFSKADENMYANKKNFKD
jgi:diguanylate cyclase (GGDEF)-like protein